MSRGFSASPLFGGALLLDSGRSNVWHSSCEAHGCCRMVRPAIRQNGFSDFDIGLSISDEEEE
jgi:hypothetical protein